MSDETKPAKRAYRAGGSPLAHDLRVRISAELHAALKAHAKRNKTTPAAAARAILQQALQPDEK